jgi:hypothetical protein
VAALLTAAVCWRRWLWANKATTLASLVLLAGAAYLMARSGVLTGGLGKDTGTMAVRLEYWRTTWRMIEERPVLGYGPGNFGRAYPRFMEESAVEKIQDPHNFALEVLADSGPVALLLLLAALALAFAGAIRATGSSPEPTPDVEAQPEAVRWEFYAGGLVGLMLGFLLGPGAHPASEADLIMDGVTAAGRSIVWFLSFALLERVRWTDRGRAIALTTGAVALLLNLCVSGGIGYPSVALPLWVCLALAINSGPVRPLAWLSRGRLALIFPVPILLTLVFVYFSYFFMQVARASNLALAANMKGNEILQVESRPGEWKRLTGEQPNHALIAHVIGPLELAHKEDPGDSRYLLMWAEWSTVLHRKYFPLAPLWPPMGTDQEARKLDPENTQAYFVTYQRHTANAEHLLYLADRAKGLAQDEYRNWAREQFLKAAQALRELLPHDPTEARWHADLAETLVKAGQKEQALNPAREALRLDAIQLGQPMKPARTLPAPQRDRLRLLLALPPPG